MMMMKHITRAGAVTRGCAPRQARRMRLGSTAPAATNATTAAAPAAPATVLVFGDSNTWGFNPKPRLVPRRLPDGRRWTDIMLRALNNENDENNNSNENGKENENGNNGKSSGGGIRLIVDALNARTTVFDDPCGPADGEYPCAGRGTLMTALHAHKPLDVVVLALGTNDLKQQFGQGPAQIASGVRILCRDVQRASHIGGHDGGSGKGKAGHETGERLDGPCPEIVIVGPPRVFETPTSLAWGFAGATEKAEATVPLLREVAASVDGLFVDLLPVPLSPLDGVHFDADRQPEIAAKVGAAVAAAVARRWGRGGAGR